MGIARVHASLWTVGFMGMKKATLYPVASYIHDGGDEGDRTPDLLTASQALSQLSYAPVTR